MLGLVQPGFEIDAGSPRTPAEERPHPHWRQAEDDTEDKGVRRERHLSSQSQQGDDVSACPQKVSLCFRKQLLEELSWDRQLPG